MNKKEIVNIHKRQYGIFEIECYEKPLRTQIAELEQENKQLKEQLEITKNALCLACKRIKNMYEQEQQYCTNEIENFVTVEYGFFIEQAKESKKDE